MVFSTLRGFAHLEDVSRPIAKLARDVAHGSRDDSHDLPDVCGAGFDRHLQGVLAGLDSLQWSHDLE